MNMSAPVAVSLNRRRSSTRGLSPLRPAKVADEKARFFVGWWQRMHRNRNGLVRIKLKTVIFLDTQTDQLARYVWEVCKWPRWRGFDWVFVCWMIDGVGMWSKKFSTKREALAFFRASPEVVMGPKAPRSADASNPPAPTVALVAAHAA